MLLKKPLAFCLMSFILLLAACGGGGSAESNSIAPDTNTQPGIISGSTVTVQGNVTYQRIGQLNTGALDYSSISNLPVRGATVELLSGTTVLASLPTSDTGQYVFTTAPGSTTLAIRVRTELKQVSGVAQWDVTVRDNTNSNALYVMQSTNFNSGLGHTQNLLAASGWGGSSYTSARVAGPFAILDTIYESQKKILSVQPNAQFPLLKVFWSLNNNTTGNGQISDGDIGTSFFVELASAGVISERQLYILGQANDDTDEYDSSVVAHEWGHYYQSAFSRDDSTGGRHGGGDDRLDRRIAFSEGWGNAWSGIVLSKSNYSDSSGTGQNSGFVLPLNSGYATGSGGSKGWFREQSIQYILWSLSNQTGFQSVHQTLSGNAFRTGTALSDIHSFSAAYRSLASVSQTAALNSLLTSESISSTSDAFGSNESNDGGNTATLPYYRQITALGNPVTLSSTQTLCGTADYVDIVNSTSGADADRNKLGLFVYLRLTLPTTAIRTITISGTPAAGVDTDFELYRADQKIYTAQVGLDQTETRSDSLIAGDYVLVIFDYNKASPGNTCYTVTIQ